MKRHFSINVSLAIALIYLLAPAGILIAQEPKPAQQPYQQQQAAPQPETVEQLRARIAAHISQPRFAPAAWGVKIVSLDTGKVIFENNAQKYFSPASNAKLYTTALALDRLGADFRIKTSLYATARPNLSGTIKGNLIIYGRGDPTMAARLNGGDYYKGLEPLINQLTAVGVRKIEGDLIADESYFVGPRLGSGWEWDDLQEYYGAEASALTLNDNALDLYVKPAARVGLPCAITTGPPTSFVTIVNRTQTTPKGSETLVTVHRPIGENTIYVTGRVPIDNASGYYTAVSVHNPAGLFAAMFKEMLAQRGIAVTGLVRVFDWKYREGVPADFSKLYEIGSVESLPLRDIVRETLKPSQNLYAQLLLLQVGANQGSGVGDQGSARSGNSSGASIAQSNGNNATRQSTAPRPSTPDPYLTTEAVGLDAMTDFLARVGVKKDDVLLEEGSGLSRKDVVTPNATVALLTFMNRHRFAEDYRNALPIAGVDGSLKNRMKDTLAAGNVRAKTGTLRYVYALSGYVTTAAGERLAFSIMLNNYYNSDRSSSARDDIDAIPIMLAGFTGRSQ
ncbi:MAG TPA: D-alanyl-D-alanine carboxypeptidase/D-alanyl-D-alanine-endopeptidase [Blastocatellia bacterium]|nr:D-alanyl-D-alanine carboxypeptidase/D-alanyl-D-alanine-endopeptidase [Blastocatellia bacterium]